jgi:hypothetical protein
MSFGVIEDVVNYKNVFHTPLDEVFGILDYFLG